MAHYNHHPHPQLTAHSQLTNLSSEQLQYLQLPTSLLPNLVGSYKKGSGIENCLICLQIIPSRSRNGSKTAEIFPRFCKLLEVSAEGQNDWGFGNDDTSAFCRVCARAVEDLIALQDQISEIQKRIQTGVAKIKTAIYDSNGKVAVTDSRLINFRFKVLGGSVNGVATFGGRQTFSQQQYSGTPCQPTATNVLDPSHLSSTSENPHSPDLYFSHSIFSSNVANQGNVAPDDDSDGFDNSFDGGGHSDENSDDNKPTTSSRGREPTSKTAPPRKKAKLDFISMKPSRTKHYEGLTVSSKEDFSPVLTDSLGRSTYEGYPIEATPSGYVCVECGAKYGSQSDNVALRKVKIHIKGFHLKAYKCPICDKNFTSQDIVSQHVSRVHQADDEICDVCGRTLRSATLIHHKFTHMNAQEKADFIASGYKPHNRTLEPKFECQICHTKFKKRNRLKAHQLTHTDVESRRNFKCDQCDSCYTCAESLKKHKIKVHTAGFRNKKMCKICGKMLDQGSLRKHMKTHIAKEDRPFVCRICGSRLTCNESLRKHEATHDGTEVFTSECDICGKKFKDNASMRNHRRKTHRNHWKAYVPPVPDVTVDTPDEFGYLEDLNNEGLQHVIDDLFSYQLYELKRISEGFQCCACSAEIVGEGDDLEEQVKNHVKGVHIGNFKCNLCTKRMKNLQEIDAHKKKDHLNEVIFSCEICMKPNITVKIFKSHEWTHKNPFEVAEAINNGEVFVERYSKSVLEYQNTFKEFGGILSFSCTLCDDNFEGVQELYNHRRNEHPEAPACPKVRRRPPKQKPEGPFPCPECGKEFRTKKNMTDHKRKSHTYKMKTRLPKVKSEESESEEEAGDNLSDSGSEVESPTTTREVRSLGTRRSPRAITSNCNTGKAEIPKEEKRFVCGICGARLSCSETLKKHEASHDGTEVFTTECDICGKRFKDMPSMRNHRRKTHRNHWKAYVPKSEDVTVDNMEDFDNEELQQIDENLFSYQLYELKRISGGFRCCTCDTELIGEGDELEEQVKSHVEGVHVGNFKCNICSKRMKNLQEFETHKKKDHLNKLVFSCEICMKPNITVKNFKGHEWTHKSPFEVAEAINNGDVFTERNCKSVLDFQNIFREFGDNLSFRCVICEESFEGVQELYNHRKNDHPDAPACPKVKRRPPKPKPVGPFPCPVCGKEYKTKKNMTDHKRTVHTNKIGILPKRQAKSPVKRNAKATDRQSSDEGSDEEAADNLSESEMPVPSSTLRTRSTRRGCTTVPSQSDCHYNEAKKRTVRIVMNRLPESANLNADTNVKVEVSSSDDDTSIEYFGDEIKSSPKSSDYESDEEYCV